METDNNNGVNPKRNNKLIIIIGIIIGVVVLGAIAFFAFGMKGDNGDTITNGKKQNNNITSFARWGNLALNLSYRIPEHETEYSGKVKKSFTYLHGQVLDYGSTFDIYIEKSLENHTNLNTLSADIMKEKLSDKYKVAYQFYKKTTDVEYDIIKNKNVKIGKIDTVYFESNDVDTKTFNDNVDKYMGYSFKYGDQYLSVYGTVDGKQQDKQELLLEYLQYIINSLEEYNGESFYELDNNFNIRDILNDGSPGTDKNRKNIFTINTYKQHVDSGNLRRDDIYINKLNMDIANWDNQLDSIFTLAQESKTVYSGFVWDKTGLYKNSSNKVLSVQDVTINNIKMKRYFGEWISDTTNKYSDPKHYVVYTFIVNEEAYIVQYAISYKTYNKYEYFDLTEDQIEAIIKLTELNADTCIRTIRMLKENEVIKTYIN